MKDTIQYFHAMDQGITYAVAIAFNREDLLETIHEFDRDIVLMVGRSYVHPNDTYCKQTGREVSSERLKPTLFKLEGSYREDEKLYVCLTNDELFVKIRVNKKSDKPHLVEVV